MSQTLADQHIQVLLEASVLCARGLPRERLLAELAPLIARVVPCAAASVTIPASSPDAEIQIAADGRAAVLPLLSDGAPFGELSLRGGDDAAIGEAHRGFLDALRTHLTGTLWAIELNRRLVERAAELEQALKARSEFLASMSHELRTPLNAVIGFAEVLTDARVGALNERQQRYLHNIQASGRHLLGVINDLLDFSRLEAGRLDMIRQPVSAPALVAEVVTATCAAATDAGLTVEVAIADGIGDLIADPLRARQALHNMVGNAIKFTPSGGGISIAVALASDESFVRISIQDTGPGVAESDRDGLFQPAFGVPSSPDQRRRGGTGLGLALTRRLVDRMGGRVGLAESSGSGACFWIELPAAPLRVEADDQRPVALIVEDDPFAIELLELQLRELGYRPISARAGDDAIAKARQHRPALITLDVFLPALDGWDVLRLLRAVPETSQIPVVMVTISTDRELSLQLGAAAHLTKPLAQDALRTAIGRLRGASPWA